MLQAHHLVAGRADRLPPSRRHERCAREVVPLLASDMLRPAVDLVFPLADIRRARERMESDERFGTVVLTT